MSSEFEEIVWLSNFYFFKKQKLLNNKPSLFMYE